MVSAADREWLTEKGTVDPVSVVACELREYPHSPADLLETLGELARDRGLTGAAAGERGRWGTLRKRPYTHVVVRAVAARPGTAVSVQTSTRGEPLSDATIVYGIGVVFASIAAAGIVPVWPTAVAYGFVCAVVGLVDGLSGRRVGEVVDSEEQRRARQRGDEWRWAFWAELERRLAARGPFR